ncbi:MAG: dTDP-4-dehydrorhamnose reductase [Bacteroidales bacterium]|nr:dTDP-4-dehydrorhamnose reductase [Bacteroidales bacterium]
MNVLVTGAYGQLGKELEYLFNNYEDLVFYGTDIDSLDITNKEAVKKYISENKIDFIVNCAAYTAVDLAEDEQEKAYQVNSDAAGILAEIADIQCIGFITISTDYVFDGRFFKPLSEKQTPNPVSVYGKSKYEGEKKAILKNTFSIIIRTSWLYSPHGKNFVKTILSLSKERDELSVVFDQIGTPTFARDLAQAIIEILLHSSEDFRKYSGIYHFSNEGVCSWYDFAHQIIKLSGNNCKISAVTSDKFPTKAERPYYSVLNKNKIKKTFNIKIPHWTESLAACIKELSE